MLLLVSDLGCLTSPMMMVGNVDATMMMQGRKPPLVIELLPTCWRVRTVSTEKQRHGDGHKKTANLQYCWASRQVGGARCGSPAPWVTALRFVRCQELSFLRTSLYVCSALILCSRYGLCHVCNCFF